MTAAVASPVAVGQVIAGKFRVERVLGVGGMGVVVAAHHLLLGRTVTLKFLLKGASRGEEAASRFLREGRALALITSPNVARVLDVGSLLNGDPYLVMEYLDGADLGDVLEKRGGLPIEEAVGYLLQVCEAVAEAHANGIVHRDLKPSNLFLLRGTDGLPLTKVLDFGISKSVEPTEDGENQYQTNTGALVGSPLYMSPEQIRNAKGVDERTDIWRLPRAPPAARSTPSRSSAHDTRHGCAQSVGSASAPGAADHQRQFRAAHGTPSQRIRRASGARSFASHGRESGEGYRSNHAKRATQICCAHRASGLSARSSKRHTINGSSERDQKCSHGCQRQTGAIRCQRAALGVAKMLSGPSQRNAQRGVTGFWIRRVGRTVDF